MVCLTIMFYVFFFFFSSRRRHTRWTGDWSSDVCSSDLAAVGVRLRRGRAPGVRGLRQGVAGDGCRARGRHVRGGRAAAVLPLAGAGPARSGRAGDRPSAGAPAAPVGGGRPARCGAAPRAPVPAGAVPGLSAGRLRARHRQAGQEGGRGDAAHRRVGGAHAPARAGQGVHQTGVRARPVPARPERGDGGPTRRAAAALEREHRHQGRRCADHRGTRGSAAALLGDLVLAAGCRAGRAAGAMMAGRRVEAVPAVGAGLEVDEYLEFLGKEYLAGFVRQGGAAVKVVVAGDDDVAARFHAGLAADAAAEGFVYAAVDASATRAHLADQLFFAVAAQVDWAALAGRAVRAAYDAAAFPVPEPPGDLAVAAVAAHHEVDARELYRSVRRALEQALLGATGLAHEFRLAMLRLCQAELGVGEVDVAERDAA